MSRIGKKPVEIPSGVNVAISGATVHVQGPRGELLRECHPDISIEVRGNEILISPLRERKGTSALWGLTRSLIAQMVEGVTNGFKKQLEFEGIGFRVNQEGDSQLLMQLGFSHPVRFSAPPGISLSVEKNVITISGIDKERVGQVAAAIRNLKPPEPYKGKGIRYRGEVIRRKAGKKAVASAS